MYDKGTGLIRGGFGQKDDGMSKDIQTLPPPDAIQQEANDWHRRYDRLAVVLQTISAIADSAINAGACGPEVMTVIGYLADELLTVSPSDSDIPW